MHICALPDEESHIRACQGWSLASHADNIQHGMSVGLLPPIVFEAGFRLKKKAFFKNIGTITAFAVVGTFISTLVFGLATWLLLLLRIVKRQHMGTSPVLTCLLYGETPKGWHTNQLAM